MKRVFISMLPVMLFASVGSAQEKQGQARLDSLLAEVPKAGTDTAGVKLLDNISYAYCVSNPDKGIAYAERAMALAQQIGWKKGEAAANNDLGNNYQNKGLYPQALAAFLRSLHIYETIGDEKAVGMVTGNIGTIYNIQKEYDKSLRYLLVSLRAAQRTGNKRGEFLTAGNIGTVYYNQGKFTEALAYMQHALRIAEGEHDHRGALNQMGNIGSVYSSMGNNEQAMDWYLKALRIAQQEGEQQMIAANEGNIGEIYLDIAKTGKNKPANLSSAVAYLRKGIAGAREIAFNQAVIEFSHALSEAYALQDAYTDALKAFQDYTSLKDSTFSLENNEMIAGLETKRLLDLKDKDIQIAKLAVAKKRNERWAFIGGIALLLGILGTLFRGFRRQQHSNRLLSAEKKRSDDLLMNILPAEVAEELKDHGTSAARQYEDVSVLFTDFVDFTGAAESLSPQALVAELNECFTAFDAIMERNGLEKIKTIGDAYMAVCGLPLPHPQHAQRAVQTALEIVQYMEERKATQQSFDIRTGINSGPVVAGIVGVKKFAYDIWGDTVNTAARMEQHGAAGRVNISSSTYNLVKDAYNCEYRGKIDAKHKGAMEMYFVAALQAQPLTLSLLNQA